MGFTEEGEWRPIPVWGAPGYQIPAGEPGFGLLAELVKGESAKTSPLKEKRNKLSELKTTQISDQC